MNMPVEFVRKENNTLAIVLVIVLVIGAAIGGYFALQWLSPFSEAGFDRGLESAAPRVVAALKDKYPTEYAAFRSDMLARAKRGDSNEALKTAVRSWLQKFMAERQKYVPVTPDAELTTLMNSARDVIQFLQTVGDAPCAGFGVGGDAGLTTVPPGATDLFDASGEAGIFAMHAGMKTPVEHKPSTEADVQVLIDEMKRRGLTDAQVGTFLDGSIVSQPASEQCKISVVLYQSLVSVPLEHGIPLMRDVNMP